MLHRIELNKGWHFKQESSLNNGAASSWLPVAQFPSVAHIDLLHHKLIPDPYIDINELKCLWVNDANWTYLTEDVSPVKLSKIERAVLIFEGLDTVVDVYLNGKHILFSKNMHISHRVDVTDILRDLTGPATLELKFQAAPEYARQERARIGYKGDGSQIHFGGSERLFLRKAQYHWGWDWGLAVNTCGPWKSIYLETYKSRINDFLVRQEVAADLNSAIFMISGNVEDHEVNDELELQIFDPSGSTIYTVSVDITKKGAFDCRINLNDVQLWYPFTYGAQPLYTIKANLSGHDFKTQTLGLRRLRLLQHSLKHAEGTSFVFEINNVRIFCGGANWIPGDFMLPRMTPKRYEDWLLLAKSGNQSMIRVWGGGIVENDVFYDVCDREGILVWQDFLFACGNYPASQDFIDEVRHEAEQQVKRVGHHPSLVIWSGNNEDYMLANRFGWEWDINNQKGPWDHTNFPAREIYERVLPDVVDRLGGDVPYWRSSPYGGSTANDSTIGDAHIWDGISRAPFFVLQHD
jgi:beta-mannosidase